MKKWLGSGMLLLTAMIWGVAFVAQSVGMDYVEPFTFNFARYIIGGVVLLPFLKLGNSDLPKENTEDKTKKKQCLRRSVIGGIGCGVLLFCASMLQQFGIMYTNVVGKAGFITALYIILVPVLGIFFRKKTKPLLWICVGISVIGLYLLCVSDGYRLELADILLLACALFFAFHIIFIDYISPNTNGVLVSCVQFFVSGLFCMVAMFLFESPSFAGMLKAYVPILYTGVLSCGVAYTFQILGQKYVEPTKASLILCLESVVAVLAGWLLLQQALSIRELLGCIIMFVAIIMAQFVQKEESI
ncbi:MAG: DMT family transporter [Lachnospiraceae bacterium]|nr:DMT family transporter [Lachnospiraceae bacterium]MBQ7833882.1 DMT family transporter [Lachnospiraceae bacterium]